MERMAFKYQGTNVYLVLPDSLLQRQSFWIDGLYPRGENALSFMVQKSY